MRVRLSIVVVDRNATGHIVRTTIKPSPVVYTCITYVNTRKCKRKLKKTHTRTQTEHEMCTPLTSNWGGRNEIYNICRRGIETLIILFLKIPNSICARTDQTLTGHCPVQRWLVRNTRSFVRNRWQT